MTRTFVFLFCTIALAMNCMAQQTISFNYPEAIADSSKTAFEKDFRQGMGLYNITCAVCHTSTVNSQPVIPTFSLAQLMDYEIRIWPQHADQLPDTKITEEELEKIILFLRYKN